MAEITASLVKELRERTGAGMMECKKALVEANGDIELAIDNMRKSGQAKAAKKAGRVAAEGVILARVQNGFGVLVEMNCETDFVAKDAGFLGLANEVADFAAAHKGTTIEALQAQFEEKRAALVAKIGENMNIRRFEKVSCDNGIVVDYIHAGGKIGVLVAAETDSTSDAVVECLKNVAMQVAAMNPKYLSSADVSDEYKEKEKEVLLAQAKNDLKNAGKPDEIIEKMIIGRLNKELKEVCLLEQPYVKAENKENVKQYIEAVATAEGCKLNVTKFVRFETGEGLEKKEEDFAAEVAAQLG